MYLAAYSCYCANTPMGTRGDIVLIINRPAHFASRSEKGMLGICSYRGINYTQEKHCFSKFYYWIGYVDNNKDLYRVSQNSLSP